MIEFVNVNKKYDDNYALKNINLNIEEGEFICVIGTSGSGKTTLLRTINRMVEFTSGKIMINNKDILSYNDVELRRKIGYVIQNIGLFPHLTIHENIMLVPNLLKWTEKKKAGVAEYLMKKVDLPLEYLNKKPKHLSGGQQQRVGVIRALAADQSIILMDEPFGAADNITREALQNLIKKIQKDMSKTIIFVTHDIDEALKLSDRIIIMNNNEIVQFATPSEIIKSPANNFVKKLIGQSKKNNLNSCASEINELQPLVTFVKKSGYVLLNELYTKIESTLTDEQENKTTKKIISAFTKKDLRYLSVVNHKKEIVGIIILESNNKLTYKYMR